MFHKKNGGDKSLSRKLVFEEELEPGDLVEPDMEECKKSFIRLKKFDWPWTIRKVEGDLVTVERRGHTETWHRRFLKKVIP
jgi:hypothetical protein